MWGRLRCTVPAISEHGIQKSPHLQDCKKASNTQCIFHCLLPISYLLSYGVLRFIGTCDTNALRLTNCALLCLLSVEVYQLLNLLSRVRGCSDGTLSRRQKEQASIQWQLMHVAVNVCLFPPVFFFGALYYTDIASLLFVLLSYHASLLCLEESGRSWRLVILQIFYALLALLFRQTNVFWVGVFPIGLAAIRLLQNNQQASSRSLSGVSFDG